MEYISIQTLQDELFSYYNKNGQKLDFINALERIHEKGTTIHEKNLFIGKKPDNWSDQEFESFLMDNLVLLDNILANDNKKMIYENAIIPFGMDVYAFHHLPYVNDGIHEHNYFELNYVYRGSCIQYITGEKRNLKEGECCIISPYTKHSVIVEDKSLVISIMIRKSTFDAIFGYLLAKNDLLSIFFRNTLYETIQSNFILFYTDNNQKIKKMIQDIVWESSIQDNYSCIYSNSLIQMLFCTLLRRYSDSVLYYAYEENNNKITDFTLILQYINKNYRTVDLKQLSEIFHYSEAYLSKLIKKNMKQNFITVVQNIKMRHAVEYLISTELGIAEIATQIGYDSVDYFTRNFKKHYQCTPSEYRNRHYYENKKSRICSK